MRAVAAAAMVLMTIVGNAQTSAQTPAYPYNYPYGLDPFRPTDAALLRQYGSVLVAQTPLLELARLDPFTPSHAALLRDLGGAIPLWGLWYPPVPSYGPLGPFGGVPGMAGPINNNVVVLADGQARAGVSGVSSSPLPLPQKMVTARRPPTNDGAWISYAGERWLSAGAAVFFDEAAFTAVGQYRGFDVFRRNNTYEVIYLPVRPGLVAPFRMKAR